jgi:dipeptidyl-peptidase-4
MLNSKFPRLFVLLIWAPFISLGGSKEISLEDIWKNGTFSSKSVSGWQPMSDGKHYTTLERSGENTCIVKFEYKSGKAVDTLVSASKLKSILPEFDLENYDFSADEKQILISGNSEPIYRHSSRSDYFVYRLSDRSLIGLSKGNKLMLAEFSPSGNQVAYIRDNNLFYKDLNTDKEFQISRDGMKNRVINGACDWVYEEEFGFDKAWQWSPDGKFIAYYRFDETEVKEFEMPTYGSLYPGKSTFKYPKAGEKNSVVNLLVYELLNNRNVLLDSGKDPDQYIPRMKWASASRLAFIRMNRLQNKLEVLIAEALSGQTRVLMTEEDAAYIDITDDWHFFKDGKSMLWSSEKNGFRHLYLHNLNTGKQINMLSSGNWEVLEVYGVDEARGRILFSSNEADPIGKSVWACDLKSGRRSRLSPEKGSTTLKYDPGFNWLVFYHSEGNRPGRVSLHAHDGKEVRELEGNKALLGRMEEYAIAKKEFMTIKTAEGTELNAWMMKPVNFDASKKYPLVFAIYGGPGHNQVVNQFDGSNFFWHQMLCQKGFIVVSVDNRGTGMRGADFRKSTYKQLGHLETLDQIAAARYFANMPYIDAQRIGIQGWSFGGYLSSLCITKGADVFKAAIAVAPVTSWRYYDSIYTERFLQTPQLNPSGYDDNSPINFVSSLKGAYLLAHGTADDNVHFQNTVEMCNALIKANKQFDLALYPDKNHGIGGSAARLHLYTKMTDFLIKNL